MATFDDISGWQEELTALLRSEIKQKVYSQDNLKTPHKKIPLKILIEFADLMLRHEETRNAIVAMHDFLALPDKQGSSDPRCPVWADTLLSDFMIWFTLKTGVGPNDWGYIKYGQLLAGSVASGQFAAVDAINAVENLKHASGFAQYIEV